MENKTVEKPVKEVMSEAEIAAKIDEVTKLPPIQYDRVRKDISKELGIRVSVLDDEYRSCNDNGEGEEELFETLEPWDEEVDGEELINEIRSIYTKHLVLQPGADVAITVFTLLTYCFDDFRILPILGVTSPDKRCGKTTCLEVLVAMANKAIISSSVTTAVTFRMIEKYKPTFVIDEADTYLKANSELHGLFNGGHTRGGAKVFRSHPVTLEPQVFDIWCPKAIGQIGALFGTLADRALPVPMRRKMVGEKVEKVPIDYKDDLVDLRRKCLRWGQDNSFYKVEPELPDVGNDRASDNWLPVIAICDRIGGEWTRIGREAMITLEGNGEEKNSVGQQLLIDIDGILKEWPHSNIFSSDLISKLNKIEGHQWEHYHGYNCPLHARGLVKILRTYQIKSKEVRIGERTKKGYAVKSFLDAFLRYLPLIPDSIRNTATKTELQADRAEKKRNTKENVADNFPSKSLKIGVCCGVADNISEKGGKGKKEGFL